MPLAHGSCLMCNLSWARTVLPGWHLTFTSCYKHMFQLHCAYEIAWTRAVSSSWHRWYQEVFHLKPPLQPVLQNQTAISYPWLMCNSSWAKKEYIHMYVHLILYPLCFSCICANGNAWTKSTASSNSLIKTHMIGWGVRDNLYLSKLWS